MTMELTTQLGLDGNEAIYQSLRTLLLTEKGSAPFRPGFGFDAASFLGGAANNLAISAEITSQIETYERRIAVRSVSVIHGAGPGADSDNPAGARRVRIVYKIKSSEEEQAYIQPISVT